MLWSRTGLLGSITLRATSLPSKASRKSNAQVVSDSTRQNRQAFAFGLLVGLACGTGAMWLTLHLVQAGQKEAEASMFRNGVLYGCNSAGGFGQPLEMSPRCAELAKHAID